MLIYAASAALCQYAHRCYPVEPHGPGSLPYTGLDLFSLVLAGALALACGLYVALQLRRGRD